MDCRTCWLGCFLFGLVLASAVVRHYEAKLRSSSVDSRATQVTWWLPLIIGHGGAILAVDECTVLLLYTSRLTSAARASNAVDLTGNSGSQATSTVIRALATGAAKPKDVFRIALREISAGALMGAALGLAMVAIVMLVWDEMSPTIALIVALSLPAVSVLSNFLGAILPLLATWVGADAEATSAPITMTLTDSCGLIAFYTISQFVLRL